MSTKSTFEAPNLSVEDLSKALYETSMRLQQANDQLRKQEKERLEFYANISHDLRAPLTAISNGVEFLEIKEGLSEEDLRTTLTLLRNRIDYMKRLVNDIFLLSSLESSDDKFHPEEVDFCFFLEDYYYFCEEDSNFANCQMSLDISEELSKDAPIINLDPHLMQRVFDNLLSNARKYCNQRPVIKIEAAYESEAKEKIVLKFSDNGIGIPAEAIPHIFDRSYQVEVSRTPDSNSSSGFGLTIVKTVIERHGGRVSCESKMGEGATFIILLPC